jgi:signal peptidase
VIFIITDTTNTYVSSDLLESHMSLREKIKQFNESKNSWVGLLRDFILVFAAFAIFASVSQIAFGLWSPMVAVESGSMTPHIETGDIIFVQSIDHTNVTTYEAGKQNGYTSFGDYGDVILYKRHGRDGTTSITHRAMYYIEEGEPMWDGGPPAPYAGYITKGDNIRTNPSYDQQGDISYLQPVKKDWIIGVARFYRIPVLGYISVIPREILGI